MKFLITLGLLTSLLVVANASLGKTSVEIKQNGYLKLTDCMKPSHNEQVMVVPINTCIHDTTTQLGGKAVKYTDVAVITGYQADGSTAVNSGDTVQYKIESYYNSDCSDASPMSVSAVMYASRNLPTPENGEFPDCGTINIDRNREMPRSYYDSSHADYVGSYNKTTYYDGTSVFDLGTYSGLAHYGVYLPSSTMTATSSTRDDSGSPHTITLDAGYSGTPAVGMSITGTGLGDNTVITGVNGHVLSLSVDTTADPSGTYTLSFFDSFAKDGHVTKYYSTSTCSSEVGGIWYKKTVCQESFAPNAAAVTDVSFKVTDLNEIIKYDHNGCGNVRIKNAVASATGTTITLTSGKFIGTPVVGMTVSLAAGTVKGTISAVNGLVITTVGTGSNAATDVADGNVDFLFEDKSTYSDTDGYDGSAEATTSTGLTQLILNTRNTGSTNVAVGDLVSGTGIATGTTITALNSGTGGDGTIVTISAATTGAIDEVADIVISRPPLAAGSTFDATQPKEMETFDYTMGSVTNLGTTSCNVVPQSKWVSGLPVAGSYYVVSGYAASSTEAPTSMPTFTAESYGQTTWDVKKRHRVGGLCENGCSGHGSCVVNQNCLCYTGMDGEPEWTGPDCSLRTCPRDYAWVGDVVNANDLHPWAECSNRGSCDRKTGICSCYPGYDGVACQRFACPNNCNERGTCWPEKHLAVKASRVYDSPWDAMKAVGCLCDAGYRGPSCEFQECPSGADPLDGYGNEAGRDCSGRGLCDYGSGTCNCFSGFYGTRCQYQTTLM